MAGWTYVSSSQSIAEESQGRSCGGTLLTRCSPWLTQPTFLVQSRTTCPGVTPSTPATDQEDVPQAALAEAVPQCRLLFS